MARTREGREAAVARSDAGSSVVLGAARAALTLLALVPLLVDTGVMYPFVTPKVLAIRALVSVASLLVVVELVRSRRARAEIAARVSALRRDPLSLSIAAMYVTLLVSTAGAANPYHAFFGDVERGEGLIGMTALYGIFLLMAILFGRRDWIRFFILIIASAIVLFGHSLAQRLGGTPRPGSLTGHPAFLGPYCLFVIAVSVLLAWNVTSRIGRIAALTGIPVAIATLLVTETRAALLGFAVALVAVLLRLALSGGDPTGSATPVRVRRLAVVLLGCLVTGAATLALTRQWPVWNRIPGLRRIVRYQGDDPTTHWRLGTWQASLKAASPQASGWRRQLFGWGPDNFHLAINRHYDPPAHQYDPGWYDRSHNVPIDVLVMTGIVGLVAHLAMWLTFLAAALRRSRPPPEQGALLFVGVAYFVQNLVSFDSLPTYVPFFALLAYAASDRSPPPAGARASYIAPGLVVAFALFSAWSLVAHTVPAYAQMRRYVRLYRHAPDPQAMLAAWAGVRTPYTYAQPHIRADFLPTVRLLLRRTRAAGPLLASAIEAMQEVARRDSLNPRYAVALGEAIDEYADAFGKPELHREAEVHLRRALTLAPGRRHLRLALVINRRRQRCSVNAVTCYYELLGQMLADRNREGATLLRERLELLDPARLPLLSELKRLIDQSKFDSVRVRVSGDDVRVTINGQRP